MPRPASLSLELLRTFLTLHRRGGDASGTAEELNINQPSMSKRLGYLQHSGPVLARPWLVREGKTWRLTEEGESVLPAVEEIVELYRQLQDFVDDPGRRGPRLRFACGEGSVGMFVRRAVTKFRKDRPDVRFRISTVGPEARVKRVANGSLDLALVDEDEDAVYEAARRPLYTQPLVNDRLLLAAAASSSWADALKKMTDGRVEPKDLESLTLILPEAGTAARRSFDEAMRSRQEPGRLDVVSELGGWPNLLAFALDRMGVAVLTESALREQPTGKRSDLITVALNPEVFAPVETRLIARRKHGQPEKPDLTEDGVAFLELLKKEADAAPTKK